MNDKRKLKVRQLALGASLSVLQGVRRRGLKDWLRGSRGDPPTMDPLSWHGRNPGASLMAPRGSFIAVETRERE